MKKPFELVQSLLKISGDIYFLYYLLGLKMLNLVEEIKL